MLSYSLLEKYNFKVYALIIFVLTVPNISPKLNRLRVPNVFNKVDMEFFIPYFKLIPLIKAYTKIMNII